MDQATWRKSVGSSDSLLREGTIRQVCPQGVELLLTPISKRIINRWKHKNGKHHTMLANVFAQLKGSHGLRFRVLQA